MQRDHITGTTTPKYRFRLKSELHRVGFRTDGQFAEAIGYDRATLSRVLNGWWIPTVRMQGRMAAVLNITLRELQTMI